MAMLAERRRKRKWCSNSNGSDWSEDNNKFGQKMLEKMGWKKGCGLGINLQGQKEHVKVSFKNDSKGLGYDGNHDVEWLNHLENYNALLSQLSYPVGDEERTLLESSSGKSLEEKSKTSRARVHYKKFVRGKDVSRYSDTDLMCILGNVDDERSKPVKDDFENELPGSKPKIKLKKIKRVKSGNNSIKDLVEEKKIGNEGVSYSDTDLVSIGGKGESVTEEMGLSDGQSGTENKKKKEKKNRLNKV